MADMPRCRESATSADVSARGFNYVDSGRDRPPRLGAAQRRPCAARPEPIRMIVPLITIAVILIVYGTVSTPLDARGITSAMVFTAAGLAVGTSGLGLVNVHIETLAAERFCELALVF